MTKPNNNLSGHASAPLRTRLWQILEVANPNDRATQIFEVFILTLISANVLSAVVSTEPSIYATYGKTLDWFEVVSVIIFSVEYLARLAACTADPRFSGTVRGRLRFMCSPMALIDLCAILPFYLPFFNADLRTLRILRLFRIIRIAKMARYSASLKLIRQVMILRKEELILSLGLTLSLLLISSCVLYYVENPVQPKAFSSIPAAMWWSVSTLTTVGYGDVYPITALGRFFAGVTAFVGVGLFALPAGIIGSGFVETIQKNKCPSKTCPHCGKSVD